MITVAQIYRLLVVVILGFMNSAVPALTHSSDDSVAIADTISNRSSSILKRASWVNISFVAFAIIPLRLTFFIQVLVCEHVPTDELRLLLPVGTGIFDYPTLHAYCITYPAGPGFFCRPARLQDGNIYVVAMSLAAQRGVFLPGTLVSDQACYDRCGCELFGSEPPTKSPPPRPGRDWSDSESDTEGVVSAKTMDRLSLEASASAAAGPRRSGRLKSGG